MSRARIHPLITPKSEAAMPQRSLPVEMSVPLDGYPEHNIKILTFDITGIDFLLDINNKTIYLIEYLKTYTEKAQVDVIVLQGVASPTIISDLKKELGDTWGGLTNVSLAGVHFPKQYIFYRRSKLLLMREDDVDQKRRTLSVSFFTLKRNGYLRLHNVWAKEGIFIDDLEDYYCSLLSKNENIDTIAVVGSLGAHIAPLDEKYENITSGIDPLSHSYHYYIPDYSIGGFYSSPSGRIRQLESCVVDLEQGDKVIDNRNIKIITEKMCPDEKLLWQTPKEVLSLDFRYQEDYHLAGKKIVDYANELSEKLHLDGIVVRGAITPTKERFISIRLNVKKCSLAANCLENLLSDKVHIIKESHGKNNYVKFFVKRNDKCFDNAVDLVFKSKELISHLTQEMLTNVIESANNLYVSNTNKIVSLCTFGYFKTFREDKIKERIQNECKGLSPIDAALAILKNKNTGCDLQAFRYYFARFLTGITLDQDAQVKGLIDYAINALESYKTNYYGKQKLDGSLPTRRQLTRTGSFDKQ